MAIEGITSVVASHQEPMAVKKVEASGETTKVTTNYGTDGAVSEIAKDTRIITQVGNENGFSGGKGEENQKQPSDETVKQTISDINKRLTNNTECVFGIHDQTNRVMIRIVDRDTKEVIKELPPEKTLDMIAKAWELAGILVDEKL